MACVKYLCLASPRRASSKGQTEVVIYFLTWSLNWVCLHDCCQLLLENKQTWCKYHNRREKKWNRQKRSQQGPLIFEHFFLFACFPLRNIYVVPNVLSPQISQVSGGRKGSGPSSVKYLLQHWDLDMNEKYSPKNWGSTLLFMVPTHIPVLLVIEGYRLLWQSGVKQLNPG